MVHSSKAGSAAAAATTSAATAAAATTTTSARLRRQLQLRRPRRGVNLSRKSVMAARRAAHAVQQQQRELARRAAKAARAAQAQRAQHKKVNKTFDRAVLHAVQEGLCAAIAALHEPVTPLSLFMGALTAAGTTTEQRHVPYLLAIAAACVPQLSQGVLLHEMERVLQLCEQLLAEHATSNHLIVAKAMKLTQTMLLAVQQPSVALVRAYTRLAPSKTHVELMQLYLTTFRKFLEQAALSSPSSRHVQRAATAHKDDDDDNTKEKTSAHHRGKRSLGDDYVLSPTQRVYTQTLPLFADACVACVADAPAAVATAALDELASLFTRSLSPYIVQSREGRVVLNNLLSHQLLSLFKPVHQTYWPAALAVVEALFDRVSYIKRLPPPSSAANDDGDDDDATQDNTPATPVTLTERLPAVTFLLKVLNKLRVLDDAALNGKVERAMTAVAAGMRARELLAAVPFDPCAAYAAEARGDAAAATALWSTSYLLGVLRRSAAHDSLPFFVEYFFPIIQCCSRAAAAAHRAQQEDEVVRWTALLQQLWRVCVGFCHYPRDVTADAFRDVAKQLVGLLSNAAFVDTAATALHVLCSGYYALAHDEDASDDDDDDEDEDASDDEDDGGADASATSSQQRRQRRRLQRHALDEDELFLSLHDAEWRPHVYHNITAAHARAVCEGVFAKYSANIMPRLCNTFETHDSTAVLLAITSFSRVCSAPVMTAILDNILAVGTSLAAATRHRRDGAKSDANSSDDDDGNKGDAATAASLTSKRRVVLDIACAVVQQLSPAQLTQLYDDVVEPVLLLTTTTATTDAAAAAAATAAPSSVRLLQKKAYKLLYAMFEHRSRDVFTLFPRVTRLLSLSRAHVTISGMKMRLRCLSWALDACKMYYPDALAQTIRALVGEVVLLARERAGQTRAMTMSLLEKMQHYLLAAGAPANTLLHLVLAGLSGAASTTLASTLVCVAKLLHMTYEQLPADELARVVALGVRLMQSTMDEVRAAACVFARMVLKLAKREARVHAAVAASLPRLLFAIALVTSQPRVSSASRTQQRVLLEKCIKRFGYDRVDRLFPLGSKAFLRYTHKMLRHEEKKAAQALKRRQERLQQQHQQSLFDRLFLGAGMRVGGDVASSSPSAAAAASSGGAGEVASSDDLLQAGALTSFMARHSAPSMAGLLSWRDNGGGDKDDNDGGDKDEYDTMHLDFAEGKLRILSRDEQQREVAQRQREELARRLLRRQDAVLTAATVNHAGVRLGKRERGDGDAADDAVADWQNEELILRYGGGGGGHSTSGKRGAVATAGDTSGDRAADASAVKLAKLRDEKLARQAAKRRRVEEDIRKGDEFVGRGEGDVKRGNVDPFAYVPLNRRYLNRRHAREGLHRFKTIAHKHLKGEKAKSRAGGKH